MISGRPLDQLQPSSQDRGNTGLKHEPRATTERPVVFSSEALNTYKNTDGMPWKLKQKILLAIAAVSPTHIDNGALTHFLVGNLAQPPCHEEMCWWGFPSNNNVANSTKEGCLAIVLHACNWFPEHDHLESLCRLLQWCESLRWVFAVMWTRPLCWTNQVTTITVAVVNTILRLILYFQCNCFTSI